ncbi:MAG: Asp23/Gls24 family envelope stress response protein [Actinomycetes bacterium]
MNATTFGASVPDTTGRTEHLAPVPPDERGRLTVDDRVVEKVAGYAVTLVTDAAAAPRRVLGVKIGKARPHDAASVQAQVQGDIASVQAAIAVRWPRSVQNVADEVRESIRSEVAAITGVRVDHVDVEVVSMTVPSAEPRVT